MTWNKPVALRDSDILQHRPISAGELDQRTWLEAKTTWFCKIPVRKAKGLVAKLIQLISVHFRQAMCKHTGRKGHSLHKWENISHLATLAFYIEYKCRSANQARGKLVIFFAQRQCNLMFQTYWHQNCVNSIRYNVHFAATMGCFPWKVGKNWEDCKNNGKENDVGNGPASGWICETKLEKSVRNAEPHGIAQRQQTVQ